MSCRLNLRDSRGNPDRGRRIDIEIDIHKLLGVVVPAEAPSIDKSARRQIEPQRLALQNFFHAIRKILRAGGIVIESRASPNLLEAGGARQNARRSARLGFDYRATKPLV